MKKGMQKLSSKHCEEENVEASFKREYACGLIIKFS
jgi:hypothetical protein